METATIEQTMTVAEGAIALNLGVTGQVHGGVQVGHFNTQVVADSHFYELSLEEPQEKTLEDPPRAEQLASLLAEHRLLILAGELEDKAGCARRIAHLLYRRLAAEGRQVSIRERCRGKDPQRIETAFHEGKTTILLLTETSQAMIAGYGLADLCRLLVGRGGYAILTTDCTRDQWEIPDGSLEARLWQELSWDTYYGRERLTGYLEHLFFDTDVAIPEGLLSEEPDGVLRVGGVALVDAVEVLKSPDHILSFFKALVEGQIPPTPEAVRDKLAELAGDTAGIRQWYLQFNDRDQLLVVGLVLLDGLPDDLLFAGLEILVETTWRGTDPLFSQFDYRDLSRFATYFKQTPVDGGFLLIESGSRARRLNLLQVAWNHQRRRLLATLPALTAMIRASAADPAALRTNHPGGAAPASPASPAPPAPGAAERALSRTKSGSAQLHQVVVESLSLIGLLSVEVVEPYLLDLATDPSETVQMLVAQALAIWRDAGREREFFSLLGRWWVDACDVGNEDSAIARVENRGGDPWAAVRAAVAIIVGYAAQYDRENQLAPQLLTLLEVLIDDPHPRVRGAVLRHALPRMVAWHLRQLEPFLRERALASEVFLGAVAGGAATACEMRPQESLPIVETWWTLARADSRHSSRRSVGSREILLATVAMTYGYLRCFAGQSLFSPEGLVRKLCILLQEEGHPFVRWHALYAIGIQTRNNFELAHRVLPDLMTRLRIEDRPQVVALAVRSYLHQRQRLEGGDRKLELDGRTYSIWTQRARPLTGIETLLYGLLLDPGRPVAQQVAVGAFAAFAATTLEREERKLLGARSQEAASEWGVGASATEPETRNLPFLGHLAILAANPQREELHPLLRPLMAEVITEHHRERALARAERKAERLRKKTYPGNAASGREKLPRLQTVEVLLERWGGVRNASTQALADRLRASLGFYRWRWGILLALLSLLAAGYYWPYRWADEAVQEPLALLAEQVVPSPVAFEDLMAPLPPGGAPLHFPYLLEGPRLVYRSLAETEVPKPLVLGEFAAPVPPGGFGGIPILRSQRTAAKTSPAATPHERASAWKKRF